MAEIQMEHKQETKLEKLLRSRTAGHAVALRACSDEQAELLRARFGDSAPGRVRFADPCRTEHPHSAFLRKSIAKTDRTFLQTTLYAPGGRLTEERSADGAVTEYFVKKPQDFEVLRGFLRDVELHPGKALPHMDGGADIATLGLTPVRELETRWAGLDLTRWALAGGDEAAASCLRKLERQLHRRAEEALRLGCCAGSLRDMAAEPLPETYMLHAGRHVEWLRHSGPAPYVETTEPNHPLLAALHAAGAGARLKLANSALHGDSFTPPEGMRFLFDLDVSEELSDPEQLACLLHKCGSAVILLDCDQAENSRLEAIVDRLLTICQ